MKKISFALALLFALVSNAQEVEKPKEGRFQLGIHYQASIDNSPKWQNGIGLDARFRLLSLGLVSLHPTMAATYRASKIDYLSDITNLNPGLFVEVNLFHVGLKPYIGMGYNFHQVTIDESDYLGSGDFDPIVNETVESESNFNGFNIDIGFRYHFAKMLYADMGFNYLSGKYQTDNFADDSTYSSSVHFGFGFRF